MRSAAPAPKFKMNSANQQIVAAYESDPNITFDTLCQAFPDYDPAAIKIVLAAGSPKFQALQKKAEGDQYFNSDVAELAVATMASLLSDEKHAFRAAKYILDDRKGRHDIRALKNVNIIKIDVAERMKKAKEAVEKSRSQPIIDIPAEMQVA